jgi:hypothetical protein
MSKELKVPNFKSFRERTLFVNANLPRLVCGNVRVPCGIRRASCACHNEACGYSIKTTGIQQSDKEFLLLYCNKAGK